jgi:hypothetical protein
MPIHLYPVNPATDYPRLAELLRATGPEPVAAAAVEVRLGGGPGAAAGGGLR